MRICRPARVYTDALGRALLGGKERRGVNELTIAAPRPRRRPAELKHCAVCASEAAELPWRLVAFGTHSNLAELMNAWSHS